jgi:hypothetical protein
MSESRFRHNPAHPIGTCSQCGGEMIYNVPRLGPDGGFVHKATGRSFCGELDALVQKAEAEYANGQALATIY